MAAAMGSVVVERPGPISWREISNIGHGGLPVAALDEIAKWVAQA